MATPVKRIEKDYLLNVLYVKQIPAIYLRGRTEYVFMLEKPARGELCLRAKRLVPGLRNKKSINLMFDYMGQVISFSAKITAVRNEFITAAVPEFLYKDLNRSYSRVLIPPDLQIQFIFREDRYSLNFPRISGYENEDPGGLIPRGDPPDLNGLMGQMAAWIKSRAGGHKLVIFGDVKPASLEERVIAGTGKALFLPSIQSGFPAEDLSPREGIITADIFGRFLESTGEGAEAGRRFLRGKMEGGIVSDLWVPLIFQEYVIGYIHIWVNKNDGFPRFDYGVLDTLCQFTKILAFSLKAKGYFAPALIKKEPFEGQVIDVSASGLLFAYPRSALASALLPDSELAVRLTASGRAIDASVRIVRRYEDTAVSYFGCRFIDMKPEDIRFFFDCIYGRPFTEADARFLAGQV